MTARNAIDLELIAKGYPTLTHNLPVNTVVGARCILVIGLPGNDIAITVQRRHRWINLFILNLAVDLELTLSAA